MGGLGAAGAFSFQGTKNLTCGEGGLIATNDPDLSEMCYTLHSIGRRRGRGPYEHFSVGWNYRLSEFQGALLNEQMRRLEGQTQLRQERVGRFLERLGPASGVAVQRVDPRVSRCSWYIVIVRTDSEAFEGIDRNSIAEALRAEGIPAGAPYGHSLHANALFQEKNFPFVPGLERLDYSRVHCPVSDHLAVNTIFLPQYIFLGSNEDVDDVIAALYKIRQHAGDLRRKPAEHQVAGS